MMGSGWSLFATVMSFGMSASLILFVCARLICCNVPSGDSRTAAATFDVRRRPDPSQQEHTIRDLESVIVATFPMGYSQEIQHSREDTQCSICLGEYEEREVLRIMPACRHNFHLACINVWLQKHSTCPICRVSLHGLCNARHVSPPLFQLLQTIDSPDEPSSAGQSGQWLLPSHQDSQSNENSQDI